MSVYRAVLLLFLAASLLGCFGGKEEPPPVAAVAAPPPPPPKPAPTRVELRVEALGDVNPSVHGTGAPVVVRIYELKGLAGFNGADFFALYDKDQASLGGDLAGKREVLLRPGEKQTLLLEPADGTGFFAALAAFRNLDSARWRVSAPIPAHLNSVFELKLGGTQMTLTALPAQQGPTAAAQAKPAPAPGEAKSPPAALPSAPSAEMPKVPPVSLPEIPSVTLPEVPSVTLPEIPSVSVPTAPAATMPSITIPPITLPLPSAP